MNTRTYTIQGEKTCKFVIVSLLKVIREYNVIATYCWISLHGMQMMAVKFKIPWGANGNLCQH